MRAYCSAGLMMSICFIGTIYVPTRLIWNRTPSAPLGLYWVNNSHIANDKWAIISSQSDAAQWASKNGFIGPKWPMIKRIVALQGDTVCRFGAIVFINDIHSATAKFQDSQNRSLPVWSGCHKLKEADVFLLNPNPNSLDGRYFGIQSQDDLQGIGHPIWTF